MNKLIAKDNFYSDCPAVMNYAAFTDHRMSSRREQYVKSINGIVRNDDYRAFLQKNSSKIMENEWNYLKTNYSCAPNPCIHNYPTNPSHGSHNEELKNYNNVRKNKVIGQVCQKLDDYRLTSK